MIEGCAAHSGQSGGSGAPSASADDTISNVMLVRGATVVAVVIAAAHLAACGGKTDRDRSGGADECDGEIAFADPRLEGAVRDAIGRPTGPIRGDDVADLSELNADMLEISDLSGIECLRGLIRLYVGDNTVYSDGLGDLGDGHDPALEISDLSPLSGLTRLTWLIVCGHSISDLSPLAEVTSLTRIDLGDNLIDDLGPLASLTSLTILVADSNEVEDLTPLAALSSLQEVYLRSNRISDLSPLVAGPALGSDDLVDLTSLVSDPRHDPNPIDCIEQAENIQTLRDRGVDVEIDCP